MLSWTSDMITSHVAVPVIATGGSVDCSLAKINKTQQQSRSKPRKLPQWRFVPRMWSEAFATDCWNCDRRWKELHLLDGNQTTPATKKKKLGLKVDVFKQHIDPAAALCCQWRVKISAVRKSGNISWFSHSRKNCMKRKTRKKLQE